MIDGSTSEITNGKTFKISQFNFSNNSNNTISLSFINKLKSKNYDSDNDVLINKFVVSGDYCVVDQKYLK